METIRVIRPRNVDELRAAGILYGDWGTSKAYVLGLTFALAGYSSFWYISAVSILALLIGINYIKICSFYPSGGGVYSSVRERSKLLSYIGAFFLISDYLITAALSALSAFHYLGIPHPELGAILAIIAIGVLNFLGPRHTGSLSLWLAIPTVLVVFLLFYTSVPFLPQAIRQLEPPTVNLMKDWNIFVGIIVALSGIESIANATGSMRLDPGSTHAKPSVIKTSTPAIIMVMLEVCIFTALLGLAMNALPGLEVSNGEISAPGYPNVRDSMLRYMGSIFGTSMFGPAFGHIFALIVSVVFALLLLSAVNTAMIALISLFFVMSRDKELPSLFQKLNRFGVPHYSTLVAFTIPVFILLIVSDVAGLANLYAIGFVGAIAINLGATATNFKLDLKLWERVLMFFTFLIMACIEITLFIDKPAARMFVIAVIGAGLLLRLVASKQKEKVVVPKARPVLQPSEITKEQEPMLVAVTGVNKSIDYALEEAKTRNQPLYVLFIREQKVVTEIDHERLWLEDDGACEVVDYISCKPVEASLNFLYVITPHTSHSISEIAKQKNVSHVILERKRSLAHLFFHTLRGTAVSDVSRHLPKHIKLIVVY